MNATIKIDTAKFSAATRELARLAFKKEPQEVMKSAAGQVLKKAVNLTPPATGLADRTAKARGELSVAADLAKLAIPVVTQANRRQRAEIFATAAQLLAAHHRARSGGKGRVNPRGRKQKLLVEQRVYLAVLRQLMSQVGSLAAGWAPAARVLKVRLPAWITRHRSPGFCRTTITRTSIRIEFGNDVKFADDVKGLARSLQKAVDSVTRNIIKTQLPSALLNVARKAGFKTS